ncbi:MAG: hypothetical protein WC622_02585 [Pedobacter sp.]|jgi:hypothetical protein|uniref:hypothetical protein n=1 Tax=Pedobacter sp. TaxID=1411316 RepID=UPI0035682145
MLQQFTWQDFLVATLVLTIIWYAAITLIFYRSEFFGLFNPRVTARTPDRLPHRWEKGVDQLAETSLEEEPELMGKSKLPEGMNRVSSDGFGFSGGGQDAESKLAQVGLVPDVLEELKGVFASLAANDGDKLDFMEMMETVREKFPKIASNPNIGRINAFVAENAPFYLSKDELETLWD